MTILWSAAVLGWGVVAAGLWRGLHGPARSAAVMAHALSLGGVFLLGTMLGYGMLVTVISATAGWWALALVTGLRPERLVDPARGGLLRLAVWLALWPAAGLAGSWAIGVKGP
ncbi:MAG: hypothetical protein QOE54_4717 [Streptosporangiaceae bacterium]|jgi:hypothetical protein|nr:hypothetical protein [Streptosporangiaceae bacterium]MDX6432351.1 hypothetical protein [Streptosporangiaceae bacterium]